MKGFARRVAHCVAASIPWQERAADKKTLRRVLRVLTATLGLVGTLTIGWSGATSAAVASPSQPIPGQYFQVVSKHNSECLMTRSWTYAEQIVTRPCQGRDYLYQWWKFDSVGGGYYRIVNAFNDMCLDVAWANYADWAHVVQGGCWGGSNQFWRMNDTSDGYFELIVQHSQKCLGISFGWAIQFGCNNQSNERFRIR